MESTSNFCPRCADSAPVKARNFSEQAVSALLVWGELEEACVDKPICQVCHDELRDILIDRADELEAGVQSSPKKAKHSRAS